MNGKKIRNGMLIAFVSFVIAMVFVDMACAQDEVLYRIKMRGDNYAARLVGVAGTRTAGDTATGAFNTEQNFNVHEFGVTTGGQYKLEYDSLGGTAFIVDTVWSGDYGKVINGTDYMSAFGAVLDQDVYESYIATGFRNEGIKFTSIYTSQNGYDFQLLKFNATDSVILGAPSIIKFKGVYYLTGGRAETLSKSFPIWSSRDLQNWTEIDSVSWWDAGKYPGDVTKVYAPRWFLDSDGSLHIFVTISAHGALAFRFFEIHPLNEQLTEWSEANFVTGVNWPEQMIDSYVVKAYGKYYMYYAEIDDDWIEKAESDYLTGPYTVTGADDWAGWGDSIEGPAMLWTGEGWVMTGDQWTVTPFTTIYSESFDSMQTWTAPTRINITDHRNLSSIRMFSNTGDMDGPPQREVTPRMPRSEPPLVEGNMYRRDGRSGTGDTLAIAAGGQWALFPSGVVNTTDSLYVTAGDDSVILGMTFEGDDFTDAKGHPTVAFNSPTFVNGAWRNTSAVSLDGINQYISIADADAKDLYFSKDSAGVSGSFSIACISKAVGGTLFDICNKRQGIKGWQWQQNTLQPQQGFFYGDGSTWDLGIGAFIDTSNYYLHIMTFDATTNEFSVYVEGYYGTGSQGAGDIVNLAIGDISNIQPFYIGRFSSLYSEVWIDELVIWKGVRSEAQINNDFINYQIKRGKQY